MNPALQALIGIALSGGFLTGIAAFLNSRSTSKQMKAQAAAVDAKLPAEIDSISVTNAERAVLTMSKALESAERRIAELERRETEAEERQEEADRVIADLRRQLTELSRQIDTCHDSLRRAEQKVAELTERLSAIGYTNGKEA